ncbi:MAG: prenyltransferase/squalene oxidase repeat-containing protein [Bacteroidota bacterium]
MLFSSLVSWKAGPTDPETNTMAIQVSITKAFSLLQTSGAVMIGKSRCASCHHSTMTAMVAAALTKKGIEFLDTTAQMREMAMVGTLDFVCNPNLNNQFVSAKFLSPYVLLGLHAQNHPADFSTDIAVDYLISQALPDGSFKAEFARVPLESGDIHLTALSIRAIDLYASAAKKTKVQQLLRQSRQWLENQHPSMQQELAFQLMGMEWCGSNTASKEAVGQKLVAMQNKDGGWSQLPTMNSDAYATGQALYALAESGTTTIAGEVYQKGVDYLVRTQDKSGAWLLVTRSNPIQPFVNTEFPPYDDNQFISAAGTNWAVLALAAALPDKK